MSLDDTAAPAAPDVSSPAPSPTPEPAAVEPAAAPAESEVNVDDDLSKVWSKHHPERDATGKFASREAKVEGEATPAPEGTAEAEVKPVEAPAPVTAIEPPRSWTAEQKAIWSKIPPEAQPLIAQRETELHEVKTATGRLAAEYKPIRDAFGQHADYLTQIGAQPAQWLNSALQISRALDSGNAAGVIKHLADQYGVDLGEIYDPLAPPPNQEILELKRELAALKGYQQTEQQTRAADQEAAQVSEFQKFVNEFKAKYPDASEIEDDIAAEIQTVRLTEPNLDHAATLEKAYERAAWANPAMRAKRVNAELAGKLKAQEEARIAAAKEAATKAKAAASVNVNGSPSSSESEDDIDANLRAIWRKRTAA